MAGMLGDEGERYERLALLPHPRGMLASEGRGSVMSPGIDLTDWIAPQWLANAAGIHNKMATDPSALDPIDAMGVAGMAMGGGMGTTRPGLGMGGRGMSITGLHNVKPGTLRVAVQFPNGAVVVGRASENTHGQIYGRLMREKHPNLVSENDPEVVSGWVDSAGRFYNRDEAAKLVGSGDSWGAGSLPVIDTEKQMAGGGMLPEPAAPTPTPVRKRYEVTVNPKYPRWNYKPWTVEVTAKSKTEATKRARRDLEGEGHWFTRDDAVSFSAREIEDIGE